METPCSTAQLDRAILTSCGKITNTLTELWSLPRLGLVVALALLALSTPAAAAPPGEVVAPVIKLFPPDWVAERGLTGAVATQLKSQGFAPFAEHLSQPMTSATFVWPFPAMMAKGLPRKLGKGSGSPSLSAEGIRQLRYSQPIVCGFGKELVVFVERGVLLDHSISHVAYRVLTSPKGRQPRYRLKAITKAIGEMLAEAWPPPTSMRLRLSLAAMPASRSGAAGACWNQAFIAEAVDLPTRFVSRMGGAYRQQVIRALEAEHLAKPRPHFKTMAYWRPMGQQGVTGTLSVQTSYHGQQVNLAEQNLSASRSPVDAPLQGSAARGASKQQASVVLDRKLAEPRFQVRYPAGWTSFLQLESRRLSHGNPPKIVARYGTWAYLDRGRGYGITMNQRFVGDGAGSSTPLFAGHVVKFFGPSAGLKDQDGKLIADGAILYLRSGRNQAVIGMPVFPDQTTFPAP